LNPAALPHLTPASRLLLTPAGLVNPKTLRTDFAKRESGIVKGVKNDLFFWSYIGKNCRTLTVATRFENNFFYKLAKYHSSLMKVYLKRYR
jgi:hypothetical protein